MDADPRSGLRYGNVIQISYGSRPVVAMVVAVLHSDEPEVATDEGIGCGGYYAMRDEKPDVLLYVIRSHGYPGVGWYPAGGTAALADDVPYEVLA